MSKKRPYKNISKIWLKGLCIFPISLFDTEKVSCENTFKVQAMKSP